MHLSRIVIFWGAGTMVTVIASLYLTSCLGRVVGCLQADACGGTCPAWQNPNLKSQVVEIPTGQLAI